MSKNIIAYFIYEMLYWAIWLGFIYGIIKLSNSFGYLWLLIVPCLMNVSYKSERVITRSDEE